jgi:N-acylglucosamine-6-phosphate 2-epimerase
MTLASLPRFWVSVQAEAHEPLGTLEILMALCESVIQGGAEGLRVAHVDLIRQLKQGHPQLPIIGLHKSVPLPADPKASVYITRHASDALALAEAGADIIALDATPRFREDALKEMIATVQAQYPHVLFMGDIDTLASASYAVEAGVHILSTTLSGYTQETEALASTVAGLPDFELLKALVQAFPSHPICLEGRVWDVTQIRQAFTCGATAVVVGSAITRPQLITARFKIGLN